MKRIPDSNVPVGRSSRRRPLIAVPLLLGIVIAVAGCTFGSPSTAASPSSSSFLPGSADEGMLVPVDEQTTPLIVTTIGPDVIPVRGTDGKYHVAYELSVLNDHPYPAVITSLQTVSPDGAVVTSLSQSQVHALTLVLPSLSTAGASAIPSGATAVFVLEDVYPDRASVPASVTHRISASFSSTDAGPDPRAAQFPTTVTQTGGPVTTSAEEPAVLGAPVAGAEWLMNNGCCDVLNYHRNVILPLNGTLHAAERYGIDFEQLQPGLAPGSALPAGADVRVKPGTDGTHVQDFYAYGAPLLAVADGTVVKVVSDVPDTPTGYTGTGEGVTLNNAGGNTVILQLAPDRFAVYFHNAPDATLVKVGDKVTKGQTIAHLGNSGNSTAPHLHFQLTRGPQSFSSENLPYVFEKFDLVATATDTELSSDPAPGPRTDELPLSFTIVDFPAAP